MSEKVKNTGGCLCGAVRYEVTQLQDDDGVGYCHCRMCQKAVGGLFAYVAVFSGAEKSGTFRFTQGEAKYYRSSKLAERGFCRECGTPLVFRHSKYVAVMIGSLDHPEDFPPDSHTGIEGQIPWLKIADGLPRWRTEDDPYFVADTQAEIGRGQ